jgi:general nucleoside transport system permease protein
MPDSRWTILLLRLGALLLALIFTFLILLASGAQPFQVFGDIVNGAVGSTARISNVLGAWVPLVLVSAGLLITFSAGLWNIGIEGQIMLGAIFTTGAIRLLQDTALPPALVIALAILAGILGGALWASLAGVLKTFGGVNEIFGGLGLNFVATSISLWLIFGPWKRPGVASMSGTEPFDAAFRLATFPGMRLSPWALLLAVLAVIFVFFLLRGTYFGLRLKAVGKNPRASYLLGVPTWQHMMLAFILCGALGGLAGAMQVTGVYHRLIPAISSGYGYMGLMIGMLVNYHPFWAAPVSLFFAALNIGSIQLPIIHKLDSSLAGVLQGVLVLFVLLAEGVRQRYFKRKAASS